MHQRSFLPAPHGRLEALWEAPDRPALAALVCHPHPLQGGTMNNNVVYRTAKALGRAGAAVLRFNFRGVGASTGEHDRGEGELDDVRAALDALCERAPDLPVWLAGFSFGARVGLRVGAEDGRVERLLGIGLVPRMFDFSFLAACRKPRAFVHGAEDELAPLTEVETLIVGLPPPRALFPVAGATHLFPGKLDALDAAVDAAIAWLAAQPASTA